MKRTTLFVDEALEHDLKAIARRRGEPMASVVREALAEYVTGEKQAGGTSLSFVAAGASGHRDTAERHEELLWQAEATPPKGAAGAATGRRKRVARKGSAKRGPR